MKKEKQIIVRVSEDEKEDFERAAEISGVALSAWVRQKLRSSAVVELKEIGEVPLFLKPKQKGA